MTKKKEEPKTPKQLADEHWAWLEEILLEEMRMKMVLFKGAIIHGIKHGEQRKESKDGVRPRPKP